MEKITRLQLLNTIFNNILVLETIIIFLLCFWGITFSKIELVAFAMVGGIIALLITYICYLVARIKLKRSGRINETYKVK